MRSLYLCESSSNSNSTNITTNRSCLPSSLLCYLQVFVVFTCNSIFNSTMKMTSGFCVNASVCGLCTIQATHTCMTKKSVALFSSFFRFVMSEEKNNAVTFPLPLRSGWRLVKMQKAHRKRMSTLSNGEIVCNEKKRRKTKHFNRIHKQRRHELKDG